MERRGSPQAFSKRIAGQREMVLETLFSIPFKARKRPMLNMTFKIVGKVIFNIMMIKIYDIKNL